MTRLRRGSSLARPRTLLYLLVEVESLAEALDLTGRVHNALRARVEGVALVAHVDPHRRTGGACLKRVAARARHSRLNVLWMDTWFHRSILSGCSGAKLIRKQPNLLDKSRHVPEYGQCKACGLQPVPLVGLHRTLLEEVRDL